MQAQGEVHLGGMDGLCDALVNKWSLDRPQQQQCQQPARHQGKGKGKGKGKGQGQGQGQVQGNGHWVGKVQLTCGDCDCGSPHKHGPAGPGSAHVCRVSLLGQIAVGVLNQ